MIRLTGAHLKKKKKAMGSFRRWEGKNFLHIAMVLVTHMNVHITLLECAGKNIYHVKVYAKPFFFFYFLI